MLLSIVGDLKRWNFSELCLGFYLLFLFILREEVFQITSIIEYSTPQYIYYDWFKFAVSYLFAPILFWLILRICLLREIKYLTLKVIVFWSLLLIVNYLKAYVIGDYFSSELIILQSISIVAIIIVIETFRMDSLKQLWEYGVYIHLAGLWINILFNLTKISNRFNAQNMDVGGTGLLLTIFIIYLWFVKRERGVFKSLFFILSIFFTGSRIGLLIIAVIVSILFASSARTEKYTYKSILYVIFSMTVLIVAIAGSADLLLNNEMVVRNLSTFSLDFYQDQDESAQGRLLSLITGFEVIKQHPFGVYNSAYSLQYVMQETGYPTFAHSTVVSLYIVWGPFAIFMYYALTKLIVRLKRNKSNYFPVIMALVVMFISTGGPMVNWKINWFQAIICYLSYKSLINGRTNQLPN